MIYTLKSEPLLLSGPNVWNMGHSGGQREQGAQIKTIKVQVRDDGSRTGVIVTMRRGWIRDYFGG